MTRISSNRFKNRLTITLSGTFDVTDALSALIELKHEVTKMQTAFDVITDLRFLKGANIQAALKIKQGTKLLENHGAKRIVRVVGGSQLAVKVFAKFATLFGSTTKVYYVPTIEEAEKILQNS